MLNLYISKNYSKFKIEVGNLTLINFELQFHNKYGHKYGFELDLLEYTPKHPDNWTWLFGVNWLREWSGDTIGNIFILQKQFHYNNRSRKCN